MWIEFFRFDLRYQLRQPLLWVVGLVMGALAFGASTSDAVRIGGAIGNINRNAPVIIVQLLGAFSLLSMFLVTIFIAGAVLRDSEIGISDMIFATPMKKRDYLIGRFAAGLLACMVIFALICVGLMIGPLMPWVDSARLGPFSLYAYGYGLAVLVIPNLLFIGALLTLLAATTRSMLLVYVGVIAFFVLWIVAGAFTRDINNEWVASLFDPFGVRALARMTRYFSAAESNSILPPVTGFLLFNRVIWSLIGLLLFGATLVLFKPQRAGTGKSWFGKSKKVSVADAAPVTAKPTRREIVIRHSTALLQCWSILRFDARAVFYSVPFLVMLLFGVMNFIASSTQAGSMFGTSVYPVTRLMLQMLSLTFNFLLMVIVTFYAGELIFKERQSKIAEVTDAMPMPNWVPLVAKCLALIGVILGFMFTGALAAIVFQLIKGGTRIEGLLYIKGVLLESTGFVLVGMLALALQVLANNKFIGYLLVILFMISTFVMGPLHLDHNLYSYAGLPNIQYSDMNGYGHFLTGWFWFALYWSLFALALLVLAQAFWVRGVSQEWRARLRMAGFRLKGRSGIALASTLAAFIVTGGWIFYNTNILNEYVPGDVKMDRQASYEKKYSIYKDLPQLKITDVQADVDIYPAERRVAIRGHYVLKNKTTAPLDILRIQTNPELTTNWTNLPPHQVTLEDKVLGFSIIRLNQPIAPDATLDLDFTIAVIHRGFTNSGTADQFNLNGTFFDSGVVFPHFGYDGTALLTDRNERRKRGLGEPERMHKLENETARADTVMGRDADWINFETTVSTSSDQVALAPGYLQKTWEQEGRRYFSYKMDKPMLPFFAYLSAHWDVKKGDWKGMPIEIYYDKKHTYNVDRMILAAQKSFDYFTAEFTPYQFQQLRILEFPAYQSFAQSFANTVPYSESIGFIADLRDPDDIDYVYYVTAHEVAHQWWAHQAIGANVQGATMLMESLAQYSALMVMEKAYGRDKMRRFLHHELDTYLRSRSGESIEELPLYRVEGQQYIHYNKGSLIFYRLRDEIGEEPLNRALKKFLQDKGFQQAPYTTTRELLTYIRAEAPPDKQAMITDMFEKIVFYDNRVTEASARQRKDGKWDVTMKLHLAKMEADGKGKETPRAYDEPVEIGVFARTEGARERDEKVLFIEKRILAGSDPTVTITVKDKPFEVGVDPYNKLIDRVSNDNRKQVSFD